MTFQSTVEKGDRYSNFWSLANRSRQNRPYTRPLTYKLRLGKIYTRGSTWQGPKALDIRNTPPISNGFDTDVGYAEASNKALDKLYEQMNQASDLLVAWKERQKALNLVATNIGRLVTIARACKRRDPKIVRRVLKRNPDAKDIVKQPAGLWLEYHFAIVPTISDIHHAMGLLGHEFPVEKITASSGVETARDRKWSSKYWHRTDVINQIVKHEGEIYGLNPNVSLATMLGFGQPLSVAWEMTPFSWFVDYFVNVGDMVKNMEPQFPGVLIRNKSSTQFVTCHGKMGRQIKKKPSVYDYFTFSTLYMERKTSWPSYQLTFSSPFDLKGQQCSYIAAVLVNILTSMKK